MKKIWAVAVKELKIYFGSPMAAIFIAVFLLFTLFTFFWVDAFFARGSADVRPLFARLPLLLIFLCATLTMRQWSEERRMGTYEVLATLPVPPLHLVLGKFIAVMTVTALALGLTAGLPVTVSLMGNLDWGPVIGGYLGALLMAGTYTALGLFISSRTTNQIVALLLTMTAGALLYVVGAPVLTGLVGAKGAEVLRALGTGSRFASIERGVLALDDIYYYVSLAAVFLIACVISMESLRWSRGGRSRAQARRLAVPALLVALNLLMVNVWLPRTGLPRLDLTRDREFSLSAPTIDLVRALDEPLLLRGYFSSETHPLLAPLIPHIRDLMNEYAIASGGKVRVEFVDPRYNDQAEAEAGEQYGIQPVPFQVAGRYEASVVNSYFHILVRYGDQFQVLDFRRLVEVRPDPAGGRPEVGLSNLEYDLTSAIKKVVQGFQSMGTVLEHIRKAELIAIVSSANLPENLKGVPDIIARAAEELARESGGKLEFRRIDPDSAGVDRAALEKEYGIRPQVASLLDPTPFYLYLFLDIDGERRPVYLGGSLGESTVRTEIEAAIRRGASGFLKTVGLWTPPAPPPMMMNAGAGPRFTTLRRVLEESYNVRDVNLADGWVSRDIDVLVLAAPRNLTDLERFAVDQYLMRGGAVVVLGGMYELNISPYAPGLAMRRLEGGLAGLLRRYGVEMVDGLVMDSRNLPFPVPVQRNVGGFTIQEIRQLPYPFFVDVRPDAMGKDPVTARLPAVGMQWASPLKIDQERTADLRVKELLHSSEGAWLGQASEVEPDFERYPDSGFARRDEGKRFLLAASLRGEFTSFFKDREDPRMQKKQEDQEEAPGREEGDKDKAVEVPSAPPQPKLDRSPATSRLVVVGSSEFVGDTVISLSQSLGEDGFLNNLEFFLNVVDWSLADEELLAIRSRGGHTSVLAPMSRGRERLYEMLNYLLALGGLLAVSLYGARRIRNEKPLVLDSGTGA